jgi:integration host factor subunit beta
MLKSDLIEKVAKELSINHDLAQFAINAVFDTMIEALAKGEGIEIRGFGSFTVRNYPGREGRNPKTGEIVNVPPRKKPFFKVGKELKNRVNSL